MGIGSSAQIEMLKLAAKALEPILGELVFVGGATAGLYVRAASAEEMRTTEDVDCVIQVSSRTAYAKIEKRLREMGLKNSTARDAPICRWLAGDLVIDVMPSDPGILGFSNRWYDEGIREKVQVDLGGVTISIMPFPYFLASKVEAFKHRGAADPRFSKDLEDIVLVLDGHADPAGELNGAGKQVLTYLKREFQEWISDTQITEAIAGFLPPSEVARARRAFGILRSIAESGSSV